MKRDKDKPLGKHPSKLEKLRQQVGGLEILETGLEFAEDEIRESEDRYQRLFELSPMGIVVLDMKGVITACNSAVGTRSGYSKDDFIGKHFSKVATIRAGDIPKFMKVFASLIRGKTPKPLEVTYTRKDGTTGWTEAHTSLLKVGGKIVGIQVIQNDITERKQMEEALKESHGFIEKVTDSLPDVIYVYDLLREENVYVSRSLNDVLGYTPEEFKAMGDTVLGRLLHPDDLELFMEYLEKLKKVKGNKIYEYEYRMKHKDGHWVWIQNRDMTFTRDSKGKPLQTIGTAADITERKQMEEALAESEKRFRGLANFLPLTVFEMDDKGDFTFVNRQGFEIFGYPMGGIAEAPTRLQATVEIFVPEDRDRVRENRQRVLNGQDIGNVEYTAVRGDGSTFPVEVFYAPIIHAGKRTGLRGILIDITDRKRAEEELRESEERYRALINLGGTVGEAIVMLQDNERGQAMHIFVSNEWPRVTGYSRKELLGMPFFDLLHPRHRAASLKRHGRKMQGEIVPGLFEMSIIRKDGTEVPVEVTSAYTAYKGERANVTFIRDITERKQAEERERQLQQELNLASRLATVGEMASGIAHEINNPLTGVIGFSSLLMKKVLPDDIRKDVNVIHEGAKRVASVVSRMLTFARQQKPERTLVNINDIVETTLAMRTYEMESSNIEVTTQLASDIPYTSADASQLQQVFLNIILNAEMEMNLAHGGGNLTVKTERIDNTIRVSFKDDGPGIPKKNLDRLFDPFFTTRDPDKGTGLGLSIGYSIVTRHGGKIYARSRLGKGATFFVELPVVTKEEQLKMAEPAAEVSKTLPRARILVVDDDTAVQELLTTILTEEGHQVEIVENGDDALEKVGSEDYDVILLDIKLPGMSGIELYKYMQKAVKSLARRVVFITGDTMSKDTMDFLFRTRAPYITKPFDNEQLMKDVDRILTEGA